jgi:uncharacterized OB-fold protein
MSDSPNRRRLLPAPEDDATAEFWAFCSAGELRFQRCSACATWRHVPRPLCAACGAEAFAWERSSGEGRLHSWTVTHQPLIRDFAEATPYVVAIVELAEGVRMACGLRGLAPEALALDFPLTVLFEEVAPGVRLPFFAPRP